ncbi:BTAD domain-containing putative transcriptional regulator [Actinoplanes sp. NPDC026670]|uniref:AfsR/SARP family transcriptional regulator n=1 Tax=Actinoplanes sp. NPDC026670 TaxID=3154700 RepID=UPI0033CBEA8B
MRFRVLGDVEMHVDGQLVEIGHARQRCVLAVLLVDANRPLTTETIIDRVWPDRPPQRARQTLAGYLSRLRQILAKAGAARITRRNGGHVLTVDPHTVDLHLFRHLVEQARAADDPQSADDSYRRALDLWRGEPFANLDTPWLAAARESLDGERRAAELEHFELALTRGRHREILPAVTAGAAAHPLDERLAGVLMTALHRSGRAAEALRHYANLRERLADELGADPSPPVQRLHRQILGAAPKPPAVVPRQLPTPARLFAGRSRELATLDRLLTQGGSTVVATVVGAAGVGKTALAVRWAHAVAARFPDGQIHLNLRGFDPGGIAVTTAEAVRGFLDALGVPAPRIPASTDAQIGLFRSIVADRRMLMLLDNAGDVAQVRPLLPGAPGCLVLVTSRNQLAGLIAGEGAVPLALDRLPADEARQLLVKHLGEARVAAETDAVDEIIARCAGLPLALSVVAARAATHPAFALEALSRELGEVESGLDALTAGDPHSDVRAALSWSYHRLDTSGARLFTLLGLHPGPDVAVPAVASLTGWPARLTASRLAGLADVNLLDEPAPARYALHDLSRLYTAELARLDPGSAADRTTAAERMVAHYLHTAYAAAMCLDPNRDPILLGPLPPQVLTTRFPDLEQARAWIAGEYPVLLTLIEHAARTGLDTDAWRLAWTLTDFLNRTGRWTDQARVFTIAADAAHRNDDQPAEGYAQRILARALARLGRHDEAHARLRTALLLFDKLGDPAGLAHTHLGVAWVHEQQNDHHQALRHDRHALDAFRAAGHLVGEARALNNIGWRLSESGDHRRGLAHTREALALCRRTGSRYDEANTLDTLGYVHGRLGEHGPAADYFRQAIGVFREVGHRDGEASALINLGDTCRTAGDPAAARTAWQAALTILTAIDHPRAEAVRTRLSSPSADAPPPPGGG